MAQDHTLADTLAHTLAALRVAAQLQSSLRGLPQGAQREAHLHVSLYRLRPPHPFTRGVAMQSFGRVRSGPWARPNIRGSVVRIGIKPEGAPYFPPDCRMLT